jgi:radical SAM superfamily enzyme YgiQ (UPF0313 family)
VPASAKDSDGQRVDCVLIYPPWTILYARAFLTNALPPLGILSIASYLEHNGLSVRVLDVHAERMSPDRLREEIARLRPRFVGICVLSSMLVSSHAIARDVKRLVPDCTVVVGGVHSELYPEAMLRNSAVDLVVRGDGEEPMLQIVKGTPWKDIKGVSFRSESNTKVVHTPAQDIRMDIDSYPMPAYHLVDINRYFPSATSYRNLPAANVIMTRGCPGKCTFCNSAMTVLRSRTPEHVFQHIRHLRETYGIRQIQFFDDTFTVNKKGVLELCKLIRESDLDITFSCYARGDCFSDEMAKALKSAGCHQIMMGIETGSDKIAKIIRKPIEHEKYRRVVEIAHENDIEVRAGFIIGSLGETWETMMESLNFAIELDVDFFQLSISTPYPGTQLFKQAMEEGRITHTNFKLYGQSDPLVRLDDLTPEDISRFEKLAFRRFYLRPRMFVRQLKRIKNFRQIKDLFNALNLLVANTFTNANPDWDEWDKLEESDVLDLNLENGQPDYGRLTFKIRKEWNESALEPAAA